MAQFFGQRRKYSKYMLWTTSVAALLYGFLGIGSFYYLYYKFQNRLFDPLFLIPTVIIFIPIFFLIYILYKKFDIMSLQYSLGIRGERYIAKELQGLSSEYSVYIDAMVNPEKGNIDYIVIGPTGIFTIEVKSHKGVITHDGLTLLRNGSKFEKDFLKQSMAQAMSLHQYIAGKLNTEVFVNPVIVFSNFIKVNFGLNKVNNVFVIQKQWLRKLIESQRITNFPIKRDLVENELKALVRTVKSE